MDNRSVVSVRIAGHDYGIRTDSDPEWLQRVAKHVDDSMERIRTRTDTVDSLAIATLAALNIARDLIELREAYEAGGKRAAAPDPAGANRLQALTRLAESELREANA